ncbi:MAG: 3-deoxy-7-phosphoheptulonate synthase [Desulfobacteraceae bacterium]|nr:3-deoxy-7-phosphoheptulonate synthase [Desulfobacteraceae bacterium]
MQTFDINIKGFLPLITPAELKQEMPISDLSSQTVVQGRQTIQDIITFKDNRILVITGPCSIHDEKAALDYAARLKELQQTVKETLFLVMRVYFEKPRTSIGWKGLINDPHLNGSHDISSGLKKARRLLCQITELGVPTATEILDPVTPQYIAGLVSWSAIGARTTESQTHREMASGLSMPVGFKNSTDGSLKTALNAIIAARSNQSFLGIDPNGKTSIVHTKGNPYAHIVLRGGKRPNYDTVSLREALDMLAQKNLPPALIIDCSHANSRKRYNDQTIVWEDVIKQRISGNHSITGLMVESNIEEGQQKNTGDLKTMSYGVSITDACISWNTTEKLIQGAHDQLINTK